MSDPTKGDLIAIQLSEIVSGNANDADLSRGSLESAIIIGVSKLIADRDARIFALEAKLEALRATTDGALLKIFTDFQNHLDANADTVELQRRFSSLTESSIAAWKRICNRLPNQYRDLTTD
jgi:hypothetical protein